MLAGSFAATQYLALRFGYDAQLGEPLALFGDTPIFEPFHWLVWMTRYVSSEDLLIRGVIYRGTAIAIGGLIVAMAVSVFINLYHNKNLLDNTDELHGSARWATRKDLEDAGLLKSTDGVYVGAWKDEAGKLQYLKHDGPEHIMAFAPTRSGKGVSLVIPTLLAWQGSCVVNDIKGENWDITAGFRAAAGHECLRFAPVEMKPDRKGVRFNPLAEIRINTERDVSDAQNLAEMLCAKPNAKADDDDYFRDGAADLLTGLILHICYVAYAKGRKEGNLDGYKATFTDLRFALAPIFKKDQDEYDEPLGKDEQLTNQQQAQFREHLEIIRDYKHDFKNDDGTWHNQWISGDGRFTPNHPAVAEAMQNMLVRADREFASVHGSANKALRLYKDPLVSYAVSGSDFRITDLVNSVKPVSLYIVVPVSDQDRLAPLVRLLYTMIVNRLTEDFNESKNYKHKLLFLVDEFPTLGRMQIFATALAYMGGYKLKAYLIAQDVEQVTEKYGEHESVTSNCHIKAAFSPNKQGTKELISKELGTQTIQRATMSFSGERTKNVLTNVSKTIEHVERPLMTPDEVGRLKAAVKEGQGADQRIIEAGEMLIMVSGNYPVRGTQLLFFKDPELLRRTDPKKFPSPPVRGSLPPLPARARQSIPKTEIRPKPTKPAPAPDANDINQDHDERSKVQDAYQQYGEQQTFELEEDEVDEQHRETAGNADALSTHDEAEQAIALKQFEDGGYDL
jgi:type IV secretion system protein VirD4